MGAEAGAKAGAEAGAGAGAGAQTGGPPPSPPLPQRHTPVAPGYRAERFQLLYAKSLERVLSKLSWDNFAPCYPTASRRAEAVLRQVQGQMVEKLGDRCGREFENIMAARQVVPKLNELERLVEEAAAAAAANGNDNNNKELSRPTP